MKKVETITKFRRFTTTFCRLGRSLENFKGLWMIGLVQDLWKFMALEQNSCSWISTSVHRIQGSSSRASWPIYLATVAKWNFPFRPWMLEIRVATPPVHTINLVSWNVQSLRCERAIFYFTTLWLQHLSVSVSRGGIYTSFSRRLRHSLFSRSNCLPQKIRKPFTTAKMIVQSKNEGYSVEKISVYWTS